jgi:1-acyl-sn-glycerol-3-phosphate acyltransferase
MDNIKAGIKLFLFALLCLFIIPTQGTVILLTRGPRASLLPMFFHRTACAIFGIRITVSGKIESDKQTIFMSNHLSYLDIPVLGSFIPGCFVSKADVRNWPVFGFLATLQQTAFMERKRSTIHKTKEELQARLENGQKLIIFPEGTSTDGQTVRPFKSGLFALAIEAGTKELMIQPVTIRVDRSDGKPITTQEERDLYAWHIDMTTEVPDHLWRFARTNGAEITLIFHPAVDPHAYQDRKELAQDCNKTVSGGLHAGHVA